jgi:iron complex transport system substrate-binding protein
MAVAVGLALACGGDSASDSEQRTAGAPAGLAPQRIIAIAPSVTEMLFELGLGDRVVGVGDYARYPSEVALIPKVGGLFDARLETIAGLNPDLAVLLPSEERLRGQLQELGVEVLTVPSDSIADVEEMARRIGDRCGVSEAAETFLMRWRADLAARTQELPIRVLLSVNRESGRMADVLVAGPGTFLDELLQRLGMINVMSDAPMAYPQVGLEEIILRQPQVIIELQAAPGSYDPLAEDWLTVASGTALSDVCIRVIAGHHVLIPGPRLPRLLRELEQAVADCSVLP